MLRSRAFRESSKIVTVLSRKHGRVDLLARGARKPRSRFGAALEMGTEADFIYYERKGEDLWTVSAADIVHSHQSLRENTHKLETLGRILKVLYYVSQPGEVNVSLYNFSLSVLNALEQVKTGEVLYDLFLWRCVVLTGYPPHIGEGCIRCGRTDARNFSIGHGGFLCKDHSKGEELIRLDRQEYKTLRDLSQRPLGGVEEKLPSVLSRLIRSYARYHLHADERVIR